MAVKPTLHVEIVGAKQVLILLAAGRSSTQSLSSGDDQH